MEINVRKGDLIDQKCDVLVVNEFLGAKETGGATGAVNEALEGRLEKIMKEEKFKAKLGATLLVRTNGEIPAKKVLLVGLGKKEEFDFEVVRQVAAVTLKQAKALNAKHVVSILHGAGAGELSARDCARAMVEGVKLADYTYSKYKKDELKSPTLFEIVSKNGRDVRNAERGAEVGKLMASGTIFARDLVNAPAHEMYPEALVDSAKLVAKGKGSIRVKVFDNEKLEKMGANAILAVAKGSEHAPYLVHMIYKPTGKAKKKVALVGKGVTFDSGGLSLKPAKSMETMKIDMAGAASVLGVFSVIDQIAPKAEVHGIFAAVENMPSGGAYRPGDIITAMNKKTIEVLNTDAEGRLALADSLVYSCKQKPDYIIDLATLTGACMVALGEEITGFMSNNEKLAEDIITASEIADEKMWELPLEKSYKKLIESDVADVKNIGGKWGGALTAGLFLQEFVNEDVAWAHLDIAAPAFAERVINSYENKGATGHGVRTLIEFLRQI